MKTNPLKILTKLNRNRMMQMKKNKKMNMNISLEKIRNKKMKVPMNKKINPTENKENKRCTFNSAFNNKNTSFLLILVTALAGIVLTSPEVFAVGESTDAGLSTGVTNLLAILNNKLTPVVLIAGCLASLIYSFAIAQPKPFILGLVTLCGFGFAKAWITGTYALIG